MTDAPQEAPALKSSWDRKTGPDSERNKAPVEVTKPKPPEPVFGDPLDAHNTRAGGQLRIESRTVEPAEPEEADEPEEVPVQKPLGGTRARANSALSTALQGKDITKAGGAEGELARKQVQAGRDMKQEVIAQQTDITRAPVIEQTRSEPQEPTSKKHWWNR